MRAVELEAGDLRLVVLPELGGGIARFDLARPKGIIPLFRTWDGAGADPNGLGCYVLCPFSNRISGGGIVAGDRFWPLAPNLAGEPYPIHGDAWQQPWTVEETSRTALGLVLESRSMPPFAYRAGLRYELADHALRARLTVRHRGRGRGPLRPRLPPLAAADAGDHAAGGGRSGLARAAGPFAGPMPAGDPAPRLGFPRAAAAAAQLGQQRLHRLARPGAHRTGRSAVSGSRSKRAKRSAPTSCSRLAPMPISSASSRSRTRSTASICRAGPRRTA